MNRILYSNNYDSTNYATNYGKRCKCNERISIKKKRTLKKPSISEGKPLQYLDSETNELFLKVFRISYQKTLSPTAKIILNNFQNKYIYYAIDDILYALRYNPTERDSLLGILYSPILSLQNNFSVNFFDIWIHEVSINEILKTNKFFNHESKTFKQSNIITIKFFYKISLPTKKPESLW